MMYQSRSGGTRQVVGTGLLAGAIQLSIGAALLAAFAGGAIRQVIHNTLKDNTLKDDTWIPVPPPPQTAVRPAAAPPANHDTTIAAPTPTHDGLAPPTQLARGPLTPLPPVDGDERARPGDGPEPRPTPTFAVLGAKPLGDTGGWITPRDYPSRALREGWSGVTRLHLLIGSDGRVDGCTVTASSGHDALDAVACEKVRLRARFSPARDGSGTNRAGTYDSAIHWQINEE